MSRSEGSPYSRFRRAIDRRQLLPALEASRDLKVVSLEDALDLCCLLAEHDDPLYPKAASRWIARLSAERGATLSELQLAAAALNQLREEPESGLSLQTLKSLIGS